MFDCQRRVDELPFVRRGLRAALPGGGVAVAVVGLRQMGHVSPGGLLEGCRAIGLWS